MNKLIHAFLDRLTERITALLATVVSSTFESYRAQCQAEQQNSLEILARQYEQNGQPQVADTLRRRAERLVTDNPVSDAETVLLNTVRQSTELAGISPTKVETTGTSDFTELPRPNSKTRRRRKTGQKLTNQRIDPLTNGPED